MRISKIALALAVLACAVPAAVGAGEENIRQFGGRIVIDVESHGEAWYVSPDTLERTYLGRPEEALYRLTRQAVRVDYRNIERIARDGEESADPAYAREMAGRVLVPGDLIGAAWYVHPVLLVRMRLGTPEDAWEVMRAGLPVSARDLRSVPAAEAKEPEPSGERRVKAVLATDRLMLEDDTEVALMSVDAPDNAEYQEPAKARLESLIEGNGGLVCLEADVLDEAADGAKLRMVKAGEVILNLEVVRRGWAFHNIETPNLKNAELLIVGGIDAERNAQGFWGR